MAFTMPSGVSSFILCSIVCVITAWYCVHDSVSCSVVGAGVAGVNGYYSAYDGTYLRRGYAIEHPPDFFKLLDVSRTISNPSYFIGFVGTGWDILAPPGGKAVYSSRPGHPELYTEHPPSSDWVGVGAGLGPKPPSDVICKGDLSSSPNGGVSNTNNMEMVTGRPITTLLLFLNLFIAYKLWANNIDVSAVSFSYYAVVEGDYWRMLTASFSHFDLMHISFNMMSLYQLGSLELEYGSVAFLFLNVDLVFITMLICMAICFIRIKYFGHVDIQHQQSIGFSCVLFAWMVAASVRMNQYCPLFFMPSLCFNTMHLSVPFLDGFSLPVNFGPFVLLVVTKVVLPRTSLVGHFSGIVIGFPLAWNLLNWMTPVVLCVFLTFSLIFSKDIWPWKLPGYSTNSPEALSEALPVKELTFHNKIRTVSTFFILLSLLGLYADGIFSLLPLVRIVIAVCCYYSHHVVRCLWLSDLRSTKLDCLTILSCVAGTIVVLVLGEIMSVVSIWTSRDLLIYSGGISMGGLVQGECFCVVYILVELYFQYLLLHALQITPEAKYYLKIVHLDDISVQRDIDKVLYLFPACAGRQEAADPFQGPGRQLVTPSDVASGTSPSSASATMTSSLPHESGKRNTNSTNIDL